MQSDNDITRVRTIQGDVISISKKKIVGFCRSTIHPGALTRDMLEEHECVEKKCHYFDKNQDASYWKYLDERRRFKEKRKLRKNAKSLMLQKEAETLQFVKDTLQECIDDLAYSMEIVRIESIGKNIYKVFYVSRYAFADGNRFPDFLETVRVLHPSWRIRLQHIRDVDGHFVTIDEFHELWK